MARSTSTLDAPPARLDPPSSPPARRGRPARWRDGRVLLGVGLVVGCVLLGVRLTATDEPVTDVWRATRDLSGGTVPGPGDLELVSLPLGDAAPAYAAPADEPAGRLDRDLRAGELVPAAALASTVPADVRLVTVPVEPLHAASDLAPGDRVDVWATPRDEVDSGVARPALVRTGALVVAVDAGATGLGGETGIVIEVPSAAAADLVAAVRSGAVDLVRVPAAAWGGRS